MKVKVSELSGHALDWAVGVAIGLELKVPEGFNKPYWHMGGELYCSKFQPSTEWMQGGPLIERYGIDLSEPPCIDRNREIGWQARPDDGATHWHSGETALIAAMRSIVAAKISYEIEIPDEFLAVA